MLEASIVTRRVRRKIAAMGNALVAVASDLAGANNVLVAEHWIVETRRTALASIGQRHRSAPPTRHASGE